MEAFVSPAGTSDPLMVQRYPPGERESRFLLQLTFRGFGIYFFGFPSIHSGGQRIMHVLWSNVFRKRRGGADGAQVIDILKRIPVFEDLNRRELAAIERILHRRSYRKEEVIFHEGDPGVGMYIIETGSVQILSSNGGPVLADLTEGEFFGELALLDESPRSATAIARAECQILGFFQPDLFGLIERNPRLGVKIVLRLARSIGERLRRANDQLQTLDQGPA